eukprot:11277231-Ditylum_brightwellii.AAC.1
MSAQQMHAKTFYSLLGVRPVAYITVIHLPSRLEGCVESTGTQTTSAQDLDDVMATLCQNRMTSQETLVMSAPLVTSSPMMTAMPKILAIRIQ